MMNTRRAVGAVVLGLALAACGNSAKSSTGSTNPNIQSAQTIVQGCVTKGDVLTSTGRKAILDCIAPAGHTAAFIACAQGQLAKAQLLTSAGRTAFLQALAVCLEQNR